MQEVEVVVCKADADTFDPTPGTGQPTWAMQIGSCMATGEQLDVEVVSLQDLEELRDAVYAVQDLPRKARRRQLAPARRLAVRMETMALSPEAAAVLAEIQLCLG